MAKRTQKQTNEGKKLQTQKWYGGQTDSKTANTDKKLRMEEWLACIKRFTLIDDTFMAKCLEDRECAELVIRIVLEDYNLKLASVLTQREIRNLQGRSIRMDVWAKDTDATEYCLEVERKNVRAIPKRARYNGSLMDANITEPGDAYKELKKTNVIFITENDVLKGEKQIYHIDRNIKELGNIPFGDDAHITYVNSSIQNDTPLGRLMHDFHCPDADKMYYNKLAQRVRYLKESKEGKKEMCEIMEELERKAEARGEARGVKKGEARGIKKGEARGEARGLKNGQERVNRLFSRLQDDGRMDDMLKSISDTAFQNQLLAEYGL